MSKVFEIAFKLGAELTSSFKGAFNEAQRQMKGLSQASEQMKSIGTSLTAKVTAPIIGLGTAAVMVGASFEEGMSKVAAVSGATGKDLENLTAKARELGAKTQFSATEASEALNFMAMAGWNTEQMLGGIDGVLSLAAASGEDLALVSDILTDSMTAFGMKANESGRFADVLAAASSNANTNVSMLGESFKYVAPLAGAMGYSAEDTSVALSLMANAGIKGSQSGTALKTMLANLASPTKKMQSAMDELGISLTNSDGTMKSLDEVMQMLRTSFSDLDEVQQAAYSSTIFGKEAMAGALAVINASEEDFNKLTDAINNSRGSAEKMAAIVNDNFKGRLKEMKSALEEAAISIYFNLQPALEAGVAHIKNLADKFNSMSPATQNTVIALVGVVAAIGPVLLGLSVLISAYINVRSAMAGLGVAMKTLKVGMLANPVLLVVAAIATLAAGLYLAYQKSEEFRNVVAPLLSVLKETFVTGVSQVGSTISEILPMLVEAFLSLGNVIVSLGTAVMPLLVNVVQSIFPLILTIVQSVFPIVAVLITNVVNIIKTLAEIVLPLVLSVIESVFPIILSIIEMVIPVVISIFETLVSVINNALVPAINAILAVVEFVFPYIKMTIENSLAIVNGIIQTAMALLRGDWDGAWEAIKITAETIMNNIIGFFQSINLVETGKQIINGLIDGIKSMGGAILGAITNVVPAPIRGVIADFLGSIGGYAEGGIVTRPELAWVGEGGDTEAIIPWNNSQRSKDLWLQTGHALGMLRNSGAIESMQQQIALKTNNNDRPAIRPELVSKSINNRSDSTIIQLNYNPQYNVQNPDDLERIRQYEKEDKDDLEARLEEIRRNERRKSFG